MENVTSNNGNGVSVEASFFSKDVPEPLKTVTAALSLAYPVGVFNNSIGNEKIVGVMYPNTPVYTTFGGEMNSLQSKGIYHGLHLEEFILSDDSKGISNSAAYEYLYRELQGRANLGKGNDVANTIISKSYNTVGEIVNVVYPQQYSLYKDFCEGYLTFLSSKYNSAENSAEGEKKTINPQQTETLN